MCAAGGVRSSVRALAVRLGAVLQLRALQKLLSILLLAVFGWLFVAPLLASAQGGDAGLPACCRRNGAHHCAMSMAERDRLTAADSRQPRWKPPIERCPYAPASVVRPQAHDTFAWQGGAVYAAVYFSHPAGTVQTQTRRRIARDRSRQKRGPPMSGS